MTDGGSSAPPAQSPRAGKFARARRLLLELGVAGLGYSLLTRCQTGNLLEDGEAAPDFSALDLDGKEVSLASLSSAPVLLHFWATWCGVCRQEFTALNAIQEELLRPSANVSRPKPKLCTLAADEDPAFVRTFAQQNKLTFPILLATPALLGLYRIKAFPTSYYLDADGRVSATTVGMSSRWAMKARLSCASR